LGRAARLVCASIRIIEEVGVRKTTDASRARKPLKLKRLGLHEREGFHRDGMLDDYFAINGEIHGMIVRMARNAPLREAHETLISRAQRARYLALGADRRWSTSVDEHAAILAALEARDGETAGRLLCSHVQQTGTALLGVLAAPTRSQRALT
jgi:DNA-binding GntR family transcriptional regulator